MTSVMLTLLLLWLGWGLLGVKLLATMVRPGLEPVVPMARVANTSGCELAYQHATHAALHGSRSLVRMLGIALGLVMVLWPLPVVVWVFTTSRGIGSL